MLAVKSSHGIYGVKDMRRSAIRRRFSRRRVKPRVIRASQRNHRVTMKEWRQRQLGFVRRTRRWNEINRVQVKALLRRLRYRDVSRVNRIERAAKKRDGVAMRRPMRLVRRVRTQRFAPGEEADSSSSMPAAAARASSSSRSRDGAT